MTQEVAAAVVTMRERGDLALATLRSLRPQVDKLYLYANNYSTTPDWLPEGLVDDLHLDPENRAGDTGNLYWADKHEGIYLSCDDDLLYEQRYAMIFSMWIEKLQGKALVTTHGLRFKHHAQVWKTATTKWDAKRHKAFDAWEEGWCFRSRWDAVLMHHEWIHQPGSGVMGFDTRVLKVPAQWSEVNNADLLLAIWAYRHEVPVCLIPHGGWECTDILPKDSPSLWKQHRAEGFTRRNELIRLCDWTQCYSVPTDALPAAQEVHPEMTEGVTSG